MHRRPGRSFGLLLVAGVSLLGGGGAALLGVCGPFTDVAADSFCPSVLEIFTLGITTGTTPTTYTPSAPVSRLQMAAFLSRTVDGALKRGSRRAALGQFWTPQGAASLGLTTVGSMPFEVAYDGADLWVGNPGSNTISRVRASDAKLLQTWSGATSARGMLAAMGRVFATGALSPDARLYRIDPAQAAGAVTTVATNVGGSAFDLAFDGSRFWTANLGGSISIVTPEAALPWTVTTVTTGFVSPLGAVFDGANVWVTDAGPNTLLKLGATGAVLLTVTVGAVPQLPVFDGANIWVPVSADSVAVVRASTGALLATLTGNGLSNPSGAAFDGQRVLVTNFGGNSVSLWKAADLTTLGSFSTGASTFPNAAASDGVNFWITLQAVNKLARF